MLVGCQKNLVHQKIPYIAILRHLENHPEAVSHELTPQRRVHICRQLISNLVNDTFIKRIVTCDENWVYYRDPDATKQWFGPHQPAKVIVEESVRPQSNVCLVEFCR